MTPGKSTVCTAVSLLKLKATEPLAAHIAGAHGLFMADTGLG